MTSTNSVDFSVRQNKAIERAITFEGLKALNEFVSIKDFIYVGLGSVWFIDFDMAHRELGISILISVEADEIVYKRAVFNKPYRTVEVHYGYSHDILPALLADRPDLTSHPWIVWLDYDQVIDETKLDELDYLIINLPANSVLLVTFRASPDRYARAPKDRPDRIGELFGDAAPQDIFNSADGYDDERIMMKGLAAATLKHFTARALQGARPGGFVPLFNLQYEDSVPMVTVGGMLPAVAIAEDIRNLASQPEWPGICELPIITPPLTPKEVTAIKTLLPGDPHPGRAEVQSLNFDLLEDQIACFVQYYLKYPSFVQTAR